MAVKKPAAAKKVAAKKPAAKTVAKSPAKKAPAKKTVDLAEPTGFEALGDKIVTALKSGNLDGHLAKFDDALTARLNAVNKETEKAAKKTTSAAERKVSAAPKRGGAKSEKAISVKPVKDKQYVVSPALKSLAGAKVKFLRFKAGDDAKVVVEMMTSKPGQPKGKRISIPASALVEK